MIGQTKWARSQIRWPRTNGPVLAAGLNRVVIVQMGGRKREGLTVPLWRSRHSGWLEARLCTQPFCWHSSDPGIQLSVAPLPPAQTSSLEAHLEYMRNTMKGLQILGSESFTKVTRAPEHKIAWGYESNILPCPPRVSAKYVNEFD